MIRAPLWLLARNYLHVDLGAVNKLLSVKVATVPLKTLNTSTMTRPVGVGHVTRDSKSVELARAVLSSEGVAAVPTDTVYGIAALAQSSTAVRKLYAIKKRDMQSPIAICVANLDEVYKWSQVTISRELLAQLLPGAVTLLFTRTHLLNPELNPDTSLVGIRIPDSAFIQMLTQVVGSPLALTSANVSKARSTLRVEEFIDLWPQLDVVFDAGPLCQLGSPQHEQRKGSTVVDLSITGFFRIARIGCCYKYTRDVLLQSGLKEWRGMIC